MSEAAEAGRRGAEGEVREYVENRVARHRILPRAVLTGVVAGLLAAAFKLSLVGIEALHRSLTSRIVGPPWLVAAVVACVAAVGTFLAMAIGRIDRDAGGSGIPHIKAVLEGHSKLNWARLILVKFTGAVAAIGSGLALGREGPTVQMGGASGAGVAELTKASGREQRALTAAGSGAGLAAAFNAPLAGVTFVLEELQRDFQPAVLGAALLSATVATAVSRLVAGNAFAFNVPDIPEPAVSDLWRYVIVGLMAGLFSLVFNRGLLFLSGRAVKLRQRLPWLVALTMGLLVGAAYLVSPTMLGGGLRLTQAVLFGKVGLTMALVYLAVRTVMVHTSYATGVPGGIFAPLLSLGALVGAVFYQGTVGFLPPGAGLAACTVAGMCSLFSGVVRAPLTGVILIAEMTGSYDMLLPLLAASFTAYAVAEGLGNLPVYEALLQRDAVRAGWTLDDGEPLTAEYEVAEGSAYDGKEVRHLGLGPGVLVILCREGGRSFVPEPTTQIRAHMRVTVASSSLAGLQEVEKGIVAAGHRNQ